MYIRKMYAPTYERSRGIYMGPYQIRLAVVPASPSHLVTNYMHGGHVMSPRQPHDPGCMPFLAWVSFKLSFVQPLIFISYITLDCHWRQA